MSANPFAGAGDPAKATLSRLFIFGYWSVASPLGAEKKEEDRRV
ncbi:hypothetical protein [Planomonospora sp. ID82291]|nr:hypothetical protein [Planomonospora sp. ID82291]